MTRADLNDAKVEGFFSIPSASLAEHNPSAYTMAMAALPPGAGSCAYCGTGILHHVVVRLAHGQQVFLGTECATKVGNEEMQACVRSKATSAELAQQQAKRNEVMANFQREEADHKAQRAARKAGMQDIFDALERQGTSFHRSLAEQLLVGALSERQAFYTAKALFGRRNQRNANDFDKVIDRVTLGSPH